MALQQLSKSDFIQLLVSYLPDNWINPEELQPANQKLTYAVMRGLGAATFSNYSQLLTIERVLILTNCVGTEVEDWFKNYYGLTFPRFAGEGDSSYALRGILRMFAPVSTRQGMLDFLTQTLATSVIVQEKKEANNTGGYLGGNLVFNTAGGGAYGSMSAGYGQLAYGATPSGRGAYGSFNKFDASNCGMLAYNVAGHYGFNGGQGLNPYEAIFIIQQLEPGATNFLTRIQIAALVETVKPIATTMWLKVIGPASTGGVPI